MATRRSAPGSILRVRAAVPRVGLSAWSARRKHSFVLAREAEPNLFSSSAACNIREIDASRSPRAGTIMKLAVATLSCALALAPAPQRPPQTRRALLAKSGIAGLSLAGPLVALPEAANAGRLQDMAAAREAKKSGGKKAAAAPKARRPRKKIKS